MRNGALDRELIAGSQVTHVAAYEKITEKDWATYFPLRSTRYGQQDLSLAHEHFAREPSTTFDERSERAPFAVLSYLARSAPAPQTKKAGFDRRRIFRYLEPTTSQIYLRRYPGAGPAMQGKCSPVSPTVARDAT